MIYLYFDLPPTPKARPRFGRVGNRVVTYTDAKTKKFEREINNLSRRQYVDEIKTGALKVEISFFIKPPKTVKRKYPSVKPDVDNLAKSVLDGIEGVVFKNDSQIISLTCSKYYRAHAGIEVKIYPIV